MKRAILLAMCLTLLCAARAEVFCVSCYGSEEDEGYALLLTEDGVPLTPPHTYAAIYELTPKGTPEAERLFGVETVAAQGVEIPSNDGNDEMVGTMRRMALMNAKGELLTGFDYTGLEYTAPRFVAYMEDWARGIMDADGNILLPAEYASIVSTGNGAWLAVALDGRPYDWDEKYALVTIDADGTRRDTGLHVSYGLGEMRCGLCAVSGVSEYGGKAVFVDAQGQVAFDRCFDYADDYRGALACVGHDDRYGLIDATGATAAPMKYAYISHDDGAGVYIANTRETVDVLDDQTGAVKFSLNFENVDYVSAWCLNAGMLNVSTNDESCIYAMDGALLVRIPADSSYSIDAMYYARVSGQPQRMVETMGQWPAEQARLIDLEFNQIGPEFQSIGAALWVDGVGRYDITRYDLRVDQDGDTVVDWRTYRRGVCDENGEIVVEPVYQYVEILSPDRFWVTTNDGAGLIDAEGHWLYSISDYEALMD